ncbi:MAG: hypothetical protein P4M08_15230 [Oligoflexia bacterium]|nr:hypothetical protein [Oligoflexia bacterium]
MAVSKGHRQKNSRRGSGIWWVGLVVSLAAALTAYSTAYASVGQGELRDLYTSAEAQGMGNAFTAIVDDDESLYYNPAGLAGVKTPKLTYLDLQAETASSIITSASSTANSLKTINSNTLNTFIGKDIYGRASLTPSLVLPGFGIGLLVDQQVAFYAENQALPAVTLGYQTTNGVKVGYGHSFFLGGSKKNAGKDEIRVGIGGELLFRRGGYYSLSESQILNIGTSEYHSIVGGFGEGVGADIGMQYIRHQNKRLSLMAGFAWESIGGVGFNNSTAQTQPGDLSIGVGARYELPGLRLTLAYDMKHLDQSTDMRMRQHFGAELKIPLVAFSLGINEVSYTAGATVDVWLAKVSLVTYAEELAYEADLATERRYLLRIAFSL